MIELIVYPKATDTKLINSSPFCSKTEIFLKICNLEYEVNNFTGNPNKFPNKKLPVLKVDNEIIADSSFIEKFLFKKFDLKINDHLSDNDLASGFMMSKMLEEYLYWSILHERWFIDNNWIELKEFYFNNIPKLIRSFVTGIIRKDVKKAALGQGMSRHSDEDVYSIGKEAIEKLSIYLGDKDFILGSKISSFDATAYAFISSMLHFPFGPKLRKAAESYPNLIAYDLRMNKYIN